MPIGRMIKHQRIAHCFMNTDMSLIHRDVEVESWCLEMEFILTGEEGEDIIEVVALFRYLGQPL